VTFIQRGFVQLNCFEENHEWKAELRFQRERLVSVSTTAE
jgi:hypothetical protein